MHATIPKTQTAALVHTLGGDVDYQTDYPVPQPGPTEVLVKVLYSGVCQSDLHTKNGTAAGPDGEPIIAIKLPHIGGHEGVGRIEVLGSNVGDGVKQGQLVMIQFLSRVCHECSYCCSGKEQHCVKSTNHLHHEDGSFQEYCVLDTEHIAILPDGIDPSIVGPISCAGVTAYKAVKNANVQKAQYVVVLGAGGGLGHLATQYGQAYGARIIGIDTGDAKRALLESYGVHGFVDFTKSRDVVQDVHDLTGGGADAVIVTTGSVEGYASAADMLIPGGALCCVGIPPGKAALQTPLAKIVIKGLRVFGNLVGSLEETYEALKFVQDGKVKVQVKIREFSELPTVYEEMEKGDIPGRVVLKIAKGES